MIKKLTKPFISLFGGVLVLTGIGLFIHKLLIADLPNYQNDMEVWAEQEMGLAVQYSELDAHFGLAGLELVLQDPVISEVLDNQNEIFSASEVRLGLNLFDFLIKQELAVNRLTLRGTDLVVERSLDGTVQFPGSADLAANHSFSYWNIPSITIDVTDSTLSYEDLSLDIAWGFEDVRLQIIKSSDDIVLEARAEAPDQLGGILQFSTEFSLVESIEESGHDWGLFAEIRDLDLAVLSIFHPELRQPSLSGLGDISIWLDMIGSDVNQGTMQVALDSLILGTDSFDQFNLTAEWSRLVNGWTLSVNNLDVSRNGNSWPDNSSIDIDVINEESGLYQLELSSSFIQLEDISPLLSIFPESNMISSWRDFSPFGQLIDLNFYLHREINIPWEYSLTGSFDGFGVLPNKQWPGIENLAGDIRANSGGGQASLRGSNVSIDLPVLFTEPFQSNEIAGVVNWWQQEGTLRIATEKLIISNNHANSETSLDLLYPEDNESTSLNLTSSITDFDLSVLRNYLPQGILSPGAYTYLSEAFSEGHIKAGDINFSGPLKAFPFDGEEGKFEANLQVENGVMNYMREWPVAEELTGTIRFFNASWLADGSGRVLGNETKNLAIGIEDFRNPVVNLSADTMGPLDDFLRFLNESPPISKQLGSEFARLSAYSGLANVALDLRVPLYDRSAYLLDSMLEITDGTLSIKGFGPTIDEINGVLVLQEGNLSGKGIEGMFLEGPILASVGIADDPGYFVDISLDGQINIEAIHQHLNFPFEGYLTGNTRWEGSILLPSATYTQVGREPLRISIGSTLSGVELGLPEPLSKLPSDPTSLQLDFVFSETDRLDVSGHLGAMRRFALSYRNRDGEFSFRRGTVHFGGGYPFLPPRDGLVINGSLEQLRLEDWWSFIGGEAYAEPLSAVLLGSEVEIENLTAFGQVLGPADVVLRRESTQWGLEIDSRPVAGSFSIPLELVSRPQIVAQLERLSLSTESFVKSTENDPRDLPGFILEVEDFTVGLRHFGSLNANIQANFTGLNMVSFETESDSFTIEGNGSWSQGRSGPLTQLALTLKSQDIATTLQQLALDPVSEAQAGNVELSVHWPDAPFSDWSQSISGDMSLNLERGSILDLEPGAGRLMGMMSITALPRRLALDFREFDRGLVFDEVRGDFLIIDGDAYTDNLYLTGPVADIGVVGRTGLRDKDYQQQAVVTAEPGKVLPAMGFLAGPQIGTAVLIFTQIFQETLSGIGRASYCVSGSWNEPIVDRLSLTELQEGKLCADLPNGVNVIQ